MVNNCVPIKVPGHAVYYPSSVYLSCLHIRNSQAIHIKNVMYSPDSIKLVCDWQEYHEMPAFLTS